MVVVDFVPAPPPEESLLYLADSLLLLCDGTDDSSKIVSSKVAVRFTARVAVRTKRRKMMMRASFAHCFRVPDDDERLKNVPCLLSTTMLRTEGGKRAVAPCVRMGGGRWGGREGGSNAWAVTKMESSKPQFRFIKINNNESSRRIFHVC